MLIGLIFFPSFFDKISMQILSNSLFIPAVARLLFESVKSRVVR